MRIGPVVLVLALALTACDDDERAPLASSGGGSHSVPVPRRDAAQESDEDAGMAADASTDGPLAYECERIDAVSFRDDGTPAVTGIAQPVDFKVTRQAATWRGDCEIDKTLAIELSDGSCPNGKGHELEILLSAFAIEDGQIALGSNLLNAEPDGRGLRVRYVRPEGMEPAGTWGSCAGSSGNIDFYEAPDVATPMELRARYRFELTSCDDTRNGPITVLGYFDLRVRRSLATVCPD